MQAFTNLGDLVDRSADAERPALIDLGGPNGPREFTHSEMDRMAGAMAAALQARGYQRGDRIAILATNRVEFLVAYFGTMRAGMISVPVNYKFPDETINFILQDAEIKLVFCDAERRSRIPAGVPVVEFDDPGIDGFQAMLSASPAATVRPDEGEVAMFLYTSGTTGRPKGVPLTHAGHIWVVEQRLIRRPDADHRLLIAAPLYHMNGLALAKVSTAAHLTVILLPQFTAPAYINAIGTYRATWLTSVAAMMAMVVRERDLLDQTDLSSVRIVRMGSAPVSQKLVDDITEILPNAEITNGYGTTEAGPVVYGPHPDGLPQPPVALGYPIPGIGGRLVDGDDMDAEEGVLHSHNPAIMPGYHNLPAKTAEVMTADGWYITGDVMRRDENGFHYFVGRVDDMFNCGGENVYPSDVEKMLERHPTIEQACVLPIPDDIKGFKPIAYVIAVEGAKMDEAEIKQYALANGPAYQHPRRVGVLTNLPLTGTNKVDRKSLIEQAIAEFGDLSQ
jgi:long-chain acyl-CoA synthetase